MPVRAIMNNSGRKLIGKYPSGKMERTIKWEGTLERDYVSILEWQQDVIEYWEQPIKIKYHLNGKMRYYTPDFLVIRNSGKSLVEVKPRYRLEDPNTLLQIKVGIDFCLKKDMHFKVVSDEIREGQFLKNIKLLERYSLENVSLFFINDAVAMVLKTESISIEELSNYMGVRGYSSAIQKVYFLVYKSIIKVNMDEPITIRSLILGGNPNAQS